MSLMKKTDTQKFRDKTKKKRKINTKKLQYGTLSVVLTVVFIAVIVLVNAGVLDEVVDGASQSRERAARPSVPAELLVVAPAVLADDRPVVGGIFHSPDDSAEPGA